jgi:ribose-phosphate pyrophosphokinase
MKIISCSSNVTLASSISREIGVELTNININKFLDTEIFVDICENVRGQDVYVIQSTSNPANDNIMELLICLDALRRASAKRVNAVIPYFGYARQDRKTTPRASITAKLIADMVTCVGVGRVLTMDLHADQIQGFFNIPVEHLLAAPVFAGDIEGRFDVREVAIVSPDIGGVVRARDIARRIGAELVIVDKRRDVFGKSSVVNIIGDIQKKKCILVDDVVDSADTLCNAVEALKKNGGAEVYAYISHGVLSGDALGKIEEIELEELVITDSIFVTKEVKETKNIRILSVASLFANAIKRVASDESVSDLCYFY